MMLSDFLKIEFFKIYWILFREWRMVISHILYLVPMIETMQNIFLNLDIFFIYLAYDDLMVGNSEKWDRFYM